MATPTLNRCARCNSPVSADRDLCIVCARDITSRLIIVPCVACGAANPAHIGNCESCGAPLQVADARDTAEYTVDFSELPPRARSAELKVIDRCLASCIDQSIPGGAIVTGDIGMGTSTLLDLFCEKAAGRVPRSRIFHIHCHRDEDSFGPIRGFLRQRFSDRLTDDPISTRVAFSQTLMTLLKPLSGALITETIHLIGHLANLSFPGSSVLRTLGADPELLQERMEVLKESYTVQVFATDIDSRAIAVARAGLYPLGIAADVTPLRLARFFTPEPDGGGYRVHKGIRDMLVFSEQDLTRDPPFSRLDLITCRNLLIYLGADLQKRLIPLFHYALNPQGFLFLGTSEGIGDFLTLFGTIDRKSKLYQRNNAEPSVLRSPSRFLPPLSALEAALPRGPGKDACPVKLPLRELTERSLLAQVAPAAALVTATGDILYLHGRTGQFLEPAPGEVEAPNILKMAREGLRPALTNALHRATALQQPVRTPGLRVKTNGHYTCVNLHVRPVLSMPAAPDAVEAHLYLVMLEEALDPVVDAAPAGAPPDALAPSPTAGADALAQIAALREELRAKDEYLQSTHEELESSNEELKSSNEEMQSVNEELQSTNEELETSKEELQSVNEELTTVNNELNIKVDDLSRLNNDMNNLLAGTGIATVFVDHQLRILRFTPTASQLINLIASDVGRPVGHIVSNLVAYSSLVADVQAVLDTLVPKELEVQTTDGAWFLLRIRPYRTLENVIEGAVITFSDIGELKRIEAALAQANRLARLAVVVRDAFDAIVMSDLDGRVLAWNPAAERLYGWTEAQALQLGLHDRVPPAFLNEAMQRLKQLSTAQVLGLHQTQRLTRSGAVLNIALVATALVDAAGKVYAISTTERRSDTA